MFHCCTFIFALGSIFITSSNCKVTIKSELPSICYASSMTSCSGNVNCSANGAIQWLYPNSTVITTTDEAAKVYVVNRNTLRFNNPRISDAGKYTCWLISLNFIKATFTLTILVNATFMYGSSLQLYEAKTALRYHDIFINCSVLPTDTFVTWKYKDSLLNTSNSNKYTENSSGLIIHNVTDDDEGQYVCSIDQTKKAYISLDIIWPPVLVSQQNQTIVVNVSEKAILNCTVSASPDPVYSWSFPDSCSSCPNTSNDSVLIFTAEDITDSGEYTCVAENEYGNVSKGFSLHIASRPVMETDLDNNTIIMEQRSITLSCDMRYAYPTPSIQWKITIPSSGLHIVLQNTSNNAGYKLYGNRSTEIYHKFMVEEGHIVVTCLATNMYGSNKKVFQLWDKYTFTKRQNQSLDFRLYIKNLTNCQLLVKDMTGELLSSLRWWFTSTCSCDGYENLHYANLTCISKHTGIVTSMVHSNGLMSPQELIDLARADILTKNPPAVHLSNGWILCLNLSSEPETEFNNGANALPMLITVGVASLCIILILLLCTITGIIYIKYKRRMPNTVSNKEDTTHIYDEVKTFSVNCSKVTDGKHASNHEVIFDTAIECQKSPTYQLISTKTAYDDKLKCNKYNDYYIKGETMCLKKEKCCTSNNKHCTPRNQA